MKVIGATLVLCGAVWGYLQFRREKMLTIRLGRALVSDLAVLKREICMQRRPLPAILERELHQGVGAEYLWHPLQQQLAQNACSVCVCWDIALQMLPEELRIRLIPLGSLLGGGGAPLARCLDEVREELRQDIGQKEKQYADSLRLAGALCLSGACFLILLLL